MDTERVERLAQMALIRKAIMDMNPSMSKRQATVTAYNVLCAQEIFNSQKG